MTLGRPYVPHDTKKIGNMTLGLQRGSPREYDLRPKGNCWEDAL